VVIAVADPWPPAAGGAAAVRAAGIDVVEGVLSDEAAEMNRVWLTSMRQRRPYVTFKAGMTVDGRIAATDGTSKWITSAASRADAQFLRRRADTMVVGIGTVLADDPLLTVREASGEPAARQPLRVVVDTDGRTPADARVCNDEAPTWIATAAEVRRAATGGLDLHDLLARLNTRGRRHVLVEGGPRLATAFVEAGLVDEFVFYLAPTLLTAGSAVLAGTACAHADRRVSARTGGGHPDRGRRQAASLLPRDRDVTSRKTSRSHGDNTFARASRSGSTGRPLRRTGTTASTGRTRSRRWWCARRCPDRRSRRG
jgi:diaminohydroxyphosphoribosylaminopyrimidine deaminase/5-amino-6-(5-phosphoribosylamino)uracil reductase